MKVTTLAITLAVGTACCIGLAASQDSKTQTATKTDTKTPAFNPNDPNDPMMKAWMEAATPSKFNALLCQDAGTWSGKCLNWMTPDAAPIETECTFVNTAIMGGRYLKQEMNGEMPGAGAMEGFAIIGYDNAAKQFQSTWIDNMGTGMMNGTGQLSSDEKTLTFEFSYFCPMTRKQRKMREVVTRDAAGWTAMDMWANDPTTGKEHKCMHIDFKRTGAAPTLSTAAAGN